MRLSEAAIHPGPRYDVFGGVIDWVMTQTEVNLASTEHRSGPKLRPSRSRGYSSGAFATIEVILYIR
jgi:hypothetical protein